MATSLAALALCHGLSCCAQWSMPQGQGRRLGKAHSIGFLRLYTWAVGRMPTGAWPSHNRLWARLRAFRTGPCPVNPSVGRATLPTTRDRPPQRTTGERMSATHGLRNITRFIDEIFRELLAYFKCFDEFCIKGCTYDGLNLMF